MSGEEQVFESRIQLVCPFCGGSATAGYVDGVGAVVHTQPTCPQFDAIEDPADYLAAARRAYVTEGKA